MKEKIMTPTAHYKINWKGLAGLTEVTVSILLACLAYKIATAPNYISKHVDMVQPRVEHIQQTIDTGFSNGVITSPGMSQIAVDMREVQYFVGSLKDIIDRNNSLFSGPMRQDLFGLEQRLDGYVRSLDQLAAPDKASLDALPAGDYSAIVCKDVNLGNDVDGIDLKDPFCNNLCGNYMGDISQGLKGVMQILNGNEILFKWLQNLYTIFFSALSVASAYVAGHSLKNAKKLEAAVIA